MVPQDLALNLKTKQKTFENQAEYKLYLLKTLKQAYEKLKNIKETEQEKYKCYFDQKHKHIEFAEGDLVWVYCGLPVAGKTFKMLRRFEGPYTILTRLDQVTYRLQKDGKTIVAHVQRLLKYHQWENILVLN